MDMILTNCEIATMNKVNSFVEAIAIKDRKIFKIGTNEDVIQFKEAGTQVIDLGGRLVLPGFNDSHMHLLMYSYNLQNVNLVGAESIDEIIERGRSYIEERNAPKGKWIIGLGWNQDYFKGQKMFPTRYDLDKISTEHPIVFIRACYHVMVVNSKALEIAGVTKDTPQIEGGYFDLDERGEPLGIFREKAQTLVNKCIPEPTAEEIKKMLKDGMKKANKCGITSIHTDDFESFASKDYEKIIKLYEELREEGSMTVRIYEQCLLPNIERLTGFLKKGYKTGYGDEFFKIGPLKLLADGSLGARTAALTKPYIDDPSTKGIAIFKQEELDDIVEKAHNSGMQIAIHGIGDKAMYMAFEAIEKAINKNPRDNHRHGIVHCQITDEILINKFKELDAIAYIQPIFADYDWHIVEDRVGVDLAKTSYNWKTFVEKGVHVACGSDCPVEEFDVLNGIYVAVTRKDLKGEPEGGWLPDQKLTVEEAIYGFTMGGAYASFEEGIKGSIEEGKLADMVILSRNLFEIPEDEIKDIKVEMTIFDGQIVYMK